MQCKYLSPEISPSQKALWVSWNYTNVLKTSSGRWVTKAIHIIHCRFSNLDQETVQKKLTCPLTGKIGHFPSNALLSLLHMFTPEHCPLRPVCKRFNSCKVCLLLLVLQRGISCLRYFSTVKDHKVLRCITAYNETFKFLNVWATIELVELDVYRTPTRLIVWFSCTKQVAALEVVKSTNFMTSRCYVDQRSYFRDLSHSQPTDIMAEKMADWTVGGERLLSAKKAKNKNKWNALFVFGV